MKHRPIVLLAAPLALAFALFMGTPLSRVQAQTPPPQAEQASSAAQSGAPGTSAPAEGHGKAEEGGHHAAPVKFMGLELGPLGKFVLQVVNFAIFFAILFLVLKGALSSAFKARAKELEDQLSQAEKDKAEGAAQLLELEARMKGMQAELADIMAKAEAEAESEKRRILDAAKTEAAQILALAQAEIDFQKRLAEKELRAVVAELAVEGARRRLEAQVQGDVAEQVLDRAIREIGGAK
ncbi:MAG TPA: ATP synthase F0 subunit B [Holophaga sp.]|nr:ATP synthase F0 subunit B [Holophaga sp.]HPS66403.1 ATP synthase F0 subunit B [Holophaga sp.]